MQKANEEPPNIINMLCRSRFATVTNLVFCCGPANSKSSPAKFSKSYESHAMSYVNERPCDQHVPCLELDETMRPTRNGKSNTCCPHHRRRRQCKTSNTNNGMRWIRRIRNPERTHASRGPFLFPPVKQGKHAPLRT